MEFVGSEQRVCGPGAVVVIPVCSGTRGLVPRRHRGDRFLRASARRLPTRRQTRLHYDGRKASFNSIPRMKLIPVNLDALRSLIDKHVAAVERFPTAPGGSASTVSYSFASGADTSREPDAKVLDAIYRHGLAWRIPKVEP